MANDFSVQQLLSASAPYQSASAEHQSASADHQIASAEHQSASAEHWWCACLAPASCVAKVACPLLEIVEAVPLQSLPAVANIPLD